jgi:hypothetical protein
MISHFIRSLLDRPGDESILNTLIDVYQNNSECIDLPTDVMTDLVKISFQSGSWDFFKDILSDAELSPDFFKWVRNNLPSEESESLEDIQDE